MQDATTLLKFRQSANKHKLDETLFAKVGQELKARGFKVKSGTILDADLISAYGIAKNADKARGLPIACCPPFWGLLSDQHWYHATKLRIDADSQSELAEGENDYRMRYNDREFEDEMVSIHDAKCRYLLSRRSLSYSGHH